MEEGRKRKCPNSQISSFWDVKLVPRITGLEDKIEGKGCARCTKNHWTCTASLLCERLSDSVKNNVSPCSSYDTEYDRKGGGFPVELRRLDDASNGGSGPITADDGENRGETPQNAENNVERRIVEENPGWNEIEDERGGDRKGGCW